MRGKKEPNEGFSRNLTSQLDETELPIKSKIALQSGSQQLCVFFF